MLKLRGNFAGFRLAPVFLLLACLFAPGVRAADSAPMLGEILKKTEDNYKQIHAFTAYFRQVSTSAAASAVTPSEATGKVFYAKPRQTRWEYEQPEPQVFVAAGAVSWLYVPAEKQISLFDADKLFSSPLARTFFDGAVSLKNHFEVSLDSKQSTKNAAVLKLVPRQEDPNIKTLFLWIDLQSYRILRIESTDLLGNTNRITLESFTVAPSLDAKLFQLDIPAGTAVVDAEGRQLSPAEVEELKLKTPSSRSQAAP